MTSSCGCWDRFKNTFCCCDGDRPNNVPAEQKMERELFPPQQQSMGEVNKIPGGRESSDADLAKNPFSSPGNTEFIEIRNACQHPNHEQRPNSPVLFPGDHDAPLPLRPDSPQHQNSHNSSCSTHDDPSLGIKNTSGDDASRMPSVPSLVIDEFLSEHGLRQPHQ